MARRGYDRIINMGEKRSIFNASEQIHGVNEPYVTQLSSTFFLLLHVFKFQLPTYAISNTPIFQPIILNPSQIPKNKKIKSFDQSYFHTSRNQVSAVDLSTKCVLSHLSLVLILNSIIKNIYHTSQHYLHHNSYLISINFF